jgi:hypothetical protein
VIWRSTHVKVAVAFPAFWVYDDRQICRRIYHLYTQDDPPTTDMIGADIGTHGTRSAA